LFLKNVSTANTRCSSDQRCMMIKGFRLLYPAMCVSPRHLQRCRHGAKCKSSNCFCPTLYNPIIDTFGVWTNLTAWQTLNTIRRQTWKWTNKLFFHPLVLTVLYSLIIMASCGSTLSYQHFRLTLVRNLIQDV
jgi:hypothetical protein